MSKRAAVAERGRGRPMLPPGPGDSPIRQLRLSRRWPLEELARRLGTTPSRLCQIELGRTPLSEGMAARLALVFGLSETAPLYVSKNQVNSDI